MWLSAGTYAVFKTCMLHVHNRCSHYQRYTAFEWSPKGQHLRIPGNNGTCWFTGEICPFSCPANSVKALNGTFVMHIQHLDGKHELAGSLFSLFFLYFFYWAGSPEDLKILVGQYLRSCAGQQINLTWDEADKLLHPFYGHCSKTTRVSR